MKQPFVKPTDAELDILQVLWSKENASVREVHNIIANTKNVGYTTTLKLMQIMFEKGIVDRDASSKVHIYRPTINKEETLNSLLNRITQSLFAGSKVDLIKQALRDNHLNEEELNTIEQLIEEQKKTLHNGAVTNSSDNHSGIQM
ncbi:BlaI/MecI/CopY family transcriptional regulator [Gynurincola endophyticus]|jgi:BlaI family penicillinase repressor|uniref:BlaI/MecI/CopY family transcriptional regulator n=1 Tax=Gynurincola endophyticus TaxID=2479004 RepID=UPI000F8E98C6|nr:BlaI/MecI/CopY family transcriptional regulator [Gynurincola endophyticus]